MDDALITYGKESLFQVFTIMSPIHFIMTLITSWNFLPQERNLPIKSELKIHGWVASFWGIFVILYNIIENGEMTAISLEKGFMIFASLLVGYAMALTINRTFRVRLLSRKKK